ncbi:MAG: EAL domain-containing protein [Sulfurimonas sp.]|uniref:EAL domain-containing protein n=1 Tax=Sulfurimonas sp. TaxID=2022749 RepID=UPI0028CEF374|nr:EAL domain-containing protein [Sulfurimonas sp.]MDT8339685.1 EAL domain-containing protein [Sulfurimonas sp.]
MPIIKLDLKSKLLLLSIITISFILVLSFMLLFKAADDKKNLVTTKYRILEAQVISRVIHFMQIERGLITGLIANENLNSNDDKLLSAMNDLDRAINDAKFTYAQTKNSNNYIMDVLSDVKLNRKSIYLLKMSTTDAKSYYTKNIATLLNFTRTIPSMMNDKENRNIIQAYTHLSSAKEALGQIRAALNEVLIYDKFFKNTLLAFAGNLELYNLNSISFQAIAPDKILIFYYDTFKGDDVDETFEIIDEALKNKNENLFNTNAGYWFEKSTKTINLLKAVEDKLFYEVNKIINSKLDLAFYEIAALSFFLIFSIIALTVLMIMAIRTVLFKTDELEQEHSDSLLLLEQYKSAVDRSFIVSKTDAQGMITYVNDEFCKISGYTKNELLGKPHNIVRHPDTPKDTFKSMWHAIKNLKQPWSGELQNLNKNGTSYWVKAVINPIMDREGNIVEYLGVRTNISEIKNASTMDFLTGYGNRTKLNNDINSLENLSVAIFNLDNFRQINDFYGHEFGNDVIKGLGDKIYNSVFSDSNLRFYRLQGDEFVILGTSYTRAQFEGIVKNILEEIKEGIALENEQILISCSCGVSFEEDKNRLLSTANMALKIAKKSNNNYLVYKESISLNKEYENNIMWSKKLSNALKNKNIITYYQPIVNNKTLGYEKYECLVRMLDEERIISPFFFLDIAKQTRQYFDITRTVIEQSFEMFKDKDVEFSINLSIDDILEPQISQYIVMMLERYGIGSKIVFEIVESEYIEKFEDVINFIAKVKKYNCKIAIDDFGTGYSNFEYLIKLRADYLKIDGSLIKNIDKDKNAYLVVSTIVDFSKKLGMKTIAEYVENDKIFDIIKELGVDYSQGYKFSEAKKDIDQGR